MPSGNGLRDLVAVLSGKVEVSQLASSQIEALVRLAQRQRVLPAFGARLAESIGSEMPAQLAEYLLCAQAEIHPRDYALASLALNTVRNADLLAQCREVVSQLSSAGIEVVPLKGAAILNQHPTLPRVLTDVDLLVTDPDRVECARSILLAAGYRDATPEEYQHETLMLDEHQIIPLLKEGHAGSIELHRTVMQTEYVPLFGVEFTHSELQRSDERDFLSLTPFAFSLHTILHAGVVDQGIRRFDASLRPAMDLVKVFREHPEAVMLLLRHASMHRGMVARAIEAMLLVTAALAPELELPKPSIHARWWWFRVQVLSRLPRVQGFVNYASLVPFALSRIRMEGRSGRPLRWYELQIARVRFFVARSRRWSRSEQKAKTTGRVTHSVR